MFFDKKSDETEIWNCFNKTVENTEWEDIKNEVSKLIFDL